MIQALQECAPTAAAASAVGPRPCSWCLSRHCKASRALPRPCGITNCFAAWQQAPFHACCLPRNSKSKQR